MQDRYIDTHLLTVADPRMFIMVGVLITADMWTPWLEVKEISLLTTSVILDVRLMARAGSE